MIQRGSLVTAALSLFFALATAYAQTTAGTISGTVRDASGAVLPGASVVILNEETGISRTVVTDTAGHYLVPALGLGQYKVTASLDGFQSEARSGIVLTVGRQAVVNFDLQVGAVTTTVEVTGEAPLVETTKGGLGSLVESAAISELPLNGRDLAQLITLQTGAVEYTAGDQDGGTGKLLVVSGARPTTNLFVIDGVGIESYSQKTPTGMSGQFLGAEAVREFRVESNAYSAEFGRGAGGIFNIATKSGTNTLHGSVFEFLRNDNLDAAKWEDNRSGVGKPEFKRNQFGASLGGPIIRDRTFYFATYEGLRERLGSVTTSLTFSDDLRRGIIPPATTPVAISSKVLPYLALWPQPNGPVRSDGTAEYSFASSEPTDEDLFQIRVDHKLSDSDNIFGRYTILDSERESAGNFEFEGLRQTVRSHTATLEYSRILSPALLNTFRYGFTRNVPTETPIQDYPSNLYFVPGVPLLGSISPSLVTSLGNGIPGEYRTVNSFQWIDDMTYSKGRNTMKFGVNINRLQFNGYNPGRDAFEFAFRRITDFFNANATGRFRGTLPNFSDAYRSFRETLFGLYFQDDVRMTPRLTVNLGLRYEFTNVPSENHGRVGTFKGVDVRSSDIDINDIILGNPWIENPSLRNFGPRVGFAWDVSGEAKTALRGGFGVFFQQFDQSWIRTSGFRVPPILTPIERASGATPSVPFPDYYQICAAENPFTTTNPLCTARAGPDVVQDKFRTPYVMQYNLNVQKQISASTVLTLGYAGSRGVRLPAVADFNTHTPQDVNGRLEFAAGLNSRPNPNFDLIRIRHVGYNSWYNSMQLNVTRKFAQGFQASGSYTFAKNIDEISGVQTASDTNAGPSTLPNPFLKDAYKSRSAFDTPHVFSFNSTYELPIGPGKMFGSGLTGVGKAILAGWQVGGIVTLSAGFPGTVVVQDRFANVGHGDEFPDLAPGASNNPNSGTSAGCSQFGAWAGKELGTPDTYFDPCAYSFPVGRTLGNLGRNTLSMPGRAVVDFNLAKTIELTEATKLQFRFEAFNSLNRPNFGTPDLEVFDSSGRARATPGQITTTVGTARQLQFALKLTF